MSIGCHVGMCLAKYLHLLISTCLTFPCQHSPVFFYVIMSGMASSFFSWKMGSNNEILHIWKAFTIFMKSPVSKCNVSCCDQLDYVVLSSVNVSHLNEGLDKFGHQPNFLARMTLWSYCHHLASINIYIIIYFSQTMGPFGKTLGGNVTWVVLNILYDFHIIWKSNMRTRTNCAF